jgi:MSHA biogenesis protein MshQ
MRGVDGNLLPLTANMSTGTLSQHDLTALPDVVALPRGVLHYQLSDDDNFFYNRSANAQVLPFDADIDFSVASIIEGDAVNLTTTLDASPGGIEIRFGRLLLKNSFGPEIADLSQQMQIEHLDDAGYVVTSNNDCVSYDASQLSLSDISLNPALTNAQGGIGNFIAGKTQTIKLAAPGVGNRGELGVLYNTPNWLKYDWDNDGAHDDNASAVATFGVFRGNDRIIAWREVF